MPLPARTISEKRYDKGNLLSGTKLLTAVAACLSVVSTAQSNEPLPTGYTEGSGLAIDYSDWSYVLKSSVMMVGNSDRVLAPRMNVIATRINHSNTNVTSLEGNRVFFHEFSPTQSATLIKLRKSLEAVSEKISLTELSRNEQLAYWLNLHNVAVMAEIASIYPVKYLKKIIEGKDAA